MPGAEEVLVIQTMIYEMTVGGEVSRTRRFRSTFALSHCVAWAQLLASLFPSAKRG